MRPSAVIVNRHPRLRPAHRPLEQLVRRILTGERQRGSVEIILAGSQLLRRLNSQYRRKRKTTDVLSFGFGRAGRPDDSGYWGEVYVNLDLLRREARAERVTLRSAVARRVVHGVLHLLGYDHRTARQAAVMTARENRYVRTTAACPPTGGGQGSSCL